MAYNMLLLDDSVNLSAMLYQLTKTRNRRGATSGTPAPARAQTYNSGLGAHGYRDPMAYSCSTYRSFMQTTT